MISAIKRFFGAKDGLRFSSKWDNLDRTEILSILAGLLEESELNRVLSVIDKNEKWTIENISEMQIFDEKGGIIRFQNDIDDLLFFYSEEEGL